MTEEIKLRRRVVETPEAERRREIRRLKNEIQASGILPLTAPDMPMPGPDFKFQAMMAGELLDVSKVKVQLKEQGKTGKNKNKTVEVLNRAGDVLTNLHRRALREPGFTMPVLFKNGQRKDVTFVTGHIWGQHYADYAEGRMISVDGPHKADVMVIGKMPWKEEVEQGRNMVGESGKMLIDILRQFHVKGAMGWYVTNLLKFMPPDGSKTIKADWLKDCLPLLHQEIRIVQPKFILCVGSDASTALLGKKNNVSYMEGRVVEFKYRTNSSADEELTEETALVMSVVHPSAVLQSPPLRRQLERGIVRFNLLQLGVRWDKEETDIDHRPVRSLAQLKDLLTEIDNDPEKTDNWIALDAEWHGEHPQNKGSYVRTIQIAWRPKHAAVLFWSDTEGQCAFFDDAGKPAQKRAVQLLSKFFGNKRLCGHFLVADLEWMVSIGLESLVSRFEVPLYDKRFELFSEESQTSLTEKTGLGPGDLVPAFMRTHVEGGWDTGLAAHAIEETAQLGLEVLTMRYTSCPRYDIPLQQWRESYCKTNGIKSKNLEGYGPCPDDVIFSYGAYDADATLRLMYEQMPLIDVDYDGNCCRESFWESMLTPPVILEMHCTGIVCDKTRIDYLTAVFMKAKDVQEKKIRDWAEWDVFNIRSVQHVKEFLFGEFYNGKVDSNNNPVRIRPQSAKSLYLEPLLDTSKPPKQWWQIKEQGTEHLHSPGTGKVILSILAQDSGELSTQVQWIRDYRYLDQVLKSILRPPKRDKHGNVEREIGEDDDDSVLASDIDASTGQEASPYSFGTDNMGGVIYEAGLAHVICGDGRVRTHFYPTTETKRWRSARPNLQNCSKRRDPDYTRLLGGEQNAKGKWVGGEYKYKLRSLLYALPDHVLVEADFIGAELYLMAVMSGDPTMIDHATRNQLPEDHPDYYDIHSNIAVTAFNLKCAPTKKGLESIGRITLRIAAKNVIFGVAYGRMAKAIALQCKEEGNPITVEQAQDIINTVFAVYPGLPPFFDSARQRTKDPGWLCSCFGALRRFPAVSDQKMQGEFERQGMNFGIQSGIASAVDRVLAYLRDYRNNVLHDPNFFKFALQLHDAAMFHVPYANVEHFVDVVLPYNMSKRLDIYPTSLDGVPNGTGPYHLGIDIEVSHHWGEGLTNEFCLAHGIPLRFAKH